MKHSTSMLIRSAFMRLLPAEMISIVVSAINALVDSMITGHFLGTGAMAAIGLFSPVTTIICLSFVIASGMQILCGQHIGSGEKDQVVSLFSTGMAAISIYALMLTALLLLFRNGLAAVLGARGETAELLSSYMTGYSFGVIGQVFSSTLMIFLPYNNDMRRCYTGIAVMVLSNAAMDLLFTAVLHLGILGMGLATSISYLAAGAYMTAGVFRSDKAICFRRKGICFSKVGKMIYLGLPELMFNLGNTVKTYLINFAVMAAAGEAGMAVMNVQGSVCWIAGAIPQGVGAAFIAMGSIYYGEEDRESYTGLLRFSLRTGLILSVGCTILLMAASPVIPYLFFSADNAAFPMASDMLLQFSHYLVWSAVFTLLTRAYQCQERIHFVNGLSLLEQLLTGLLAFLGTKVIGISGVWLAFPLTDVICLAVIGIYAWIKERKLPGTLAAWIQLSPSFGVSPDKVMEFSPASMEEVVSISSRITAFCTEKGIDPRRSNIAGLCVEEMAGNVVAHGFKPGRNHFLDIRIVTGERIIIRIRDNCREFDPRKRMDQFDPKDPMKNFAIRMVARIAEEMNYRNDAGINTLLIKC